MWMAGFVIIYQIPRMCISSTSRWCSPRMYSLCGLSGIIRSRWWSRWFHYISRLLGCQISYSTIKFLLELAPFRARFGWFVRVSRWNRFLDPLHSIFAKYRRLNRWCFWIWVFCIPCSERNRTSESYSRARWSSWSQWAFAPIRKIVHLPPNLFSPPWLTCAPQFTLFSRRRCRWHHFRCRQLTVSWTSS